MSEPKAKKAKVKYAFKAKKYQEVAFAQKVKGWKNLKQVISSQKNVSQITCK